MDIPGKVRADNRSLSEPAASGKFELFLEDPQRAFRILFHDHPQPMWFFHSESREVVAVNDAAIRFYGFSEEEFLGKTVDDLRLERQSVRNVIVEKSRASIDVRETERHRKKDGTQIDVEISVHQLQTKESSVFLAIVHDITDRKRAEAALKNSSEAALRESQQRIAGIINSAMDAIITVDAQQNIVLFNAAAEMMFGRRAQDVLGQSLDIFIPERFRSLHREHIPAFGQTHVTKRRMGALGAIFGVRANGEEFPIEASISQVETGGQKLYTVILRDISERERIEAERQRLTSMIKKSAGEWQMTFDAIESPVFILDVEDRIVRVNRAAKMLMNGNERTMIGEKIDSLDSGPIWRAVIDLVASIRKTRVSSASQARDELSKCTWDLAASMADDPEGDQERVILVIREITQIVELQASLHHSKTMSMLGSLVSGVAHEVRNPLFGISSTLDAFEAHYGGTEEHKPYTTVLHGEVDRLNRLMKGLLEYGRPNNSRLEPGSIKDVLTEAIAACGPAAKQAGAAIIDQCNPLLPLIWMNHTRLLQVFLNLLENAVQHTSAGDAVRIEADAARRDDREWVVCTIKDSGPGFDPKDMPRLFEPFFTRRRGGTGLGLSIVQKIVEEHSGGLTLENRPEGGACVSVRFPVANNQPPGAVDQNAQK